MVMENRSVQLMYFNLHDTVKPATHLSRYDHDMLTKRETRQVCRGFSQCFSYDEKQFFPVSCVVAFRSEERFLRETSKEYRIYAIRRQCEKEKCTKHDKCVEVISSSFRIRYIFRDIAVKCPRYAIHDKCVAGFIDAIGISKMESCDLKVLKLSCFYPSVTENFRMKEIYIQFYNNYLTT